MQNAAQLQVTATNNQVAAAARPVPSASAQVAKMRQRGGASRVELQLMVAELECKLEDRKRESEQLLQQLEAERAARRRAGDVAGSGEACGAYFAPVAAAAAEEEGLEEEEVPEDDGAAREMCRRLHTEKRALQRERAAMRREISAMRETLKAADSQLRRRNNEAVKDGRTITELQEAVVTLQQSLKHATGPPAPPSEDAAAAARGERATAAWQKPQLASAMSSNRVSKPSVKFLDGLRWWRGMRCVRLRVRRAR
jgi:predicted RNase H-like nuclease (RuvC/YqgF family)